MCGRTACTLAPDDICQRCTYKNSRGTQVQPQWRDAPGGQKYYPSYNMAPSAHSPVIISAKHCTEATEKASTADITEHERVIQPMQWGLVPHWHKGSDTSSFGYKMNNARSDGLLSKVTFKRPLESGKRCVVLADGYFEWHTPTGGKKQPYFIYFPSADNELSKDCKKEVKEVVKLENDAMEGKEVVKQESVSEEEVKDTTAANRLITMAGLFDVWKSEEGETLYSYSIITVDAHKSLSFIHDRMPAILNNEEEINRWLDDKTPLDEVMKLIRPVGTLTCHPVSTAVNDSRYKSSDTIIAVDLEAESKKKNKISAESSFMKGWLKSGTPQKRSGEESEQGDTKKQKP